MYLMCRHIKTQTAQCVWYFAEASLIDLGRSLGGIVLLGDSQDQNSCGGEAVLPDGLVLTTAPEVPQMF